MTVDIARLSAELARLAEFSDVPHPAVTRVMLGDTDLAARTYLIDLFTAAGLRVRIDPAGNLSIAKKRPSSSSTPIRRQRTMRP